MSGLLLSLFPGVDLLGRGFELEAFTVVRGPDPIFGGDVRDFHVPRGAGEGFIGGPPCQDFSTLLRTEPTGAGVEMLFHYARLVTEGRPRWFLLENVPGVPDVAVPGYRVQRFNLRASECGARQHRLRTFQFGSRSGRPLDIERTAPLQDAERACLASEGRRVGRRGWADFCALMGLPRDFDLPSFTLTAKYEAVGNGVPIPMARVIARAVKRWQVTRRRVRVCVCGCGREVPSTRTLATVGCRKIMQRRRDAAGVTGPGPVTAGASLFA